MDDEATILVEYPKAQGIIQASWNWPFSRKDFEVYAREIVRRRDRRQQPAGADARRSATRRRARPRSLPPDERDSISYLIAVVRGKLKPAGLSSLENNVIVTEILEAARESVRTGKTIVLSDRDR